MGMDYEWGMGNWEWGIVSPIRDYGLRDNFGNREVIDRAGFVQQLSSNAIRVTLTPNT
ncbi:MAG: hypothetical protein F6K47_15655 [Symploca sp. SIO2E6]|nr:hypothetical protein [Symploca sp. SIO2E6]